MPDSLVVVRPALGQADHPAAQDKVLDVVFGHGDQAGCVRAGWAREEDAGSVAARLKQGHCGGHGRQASRDQTWQTSWWAGQHSPWKATMLAEMLASSSRMLGRVGWNRYRLCWGSLGS